jgi:hypothetical protein
MPMVTTAEAIATARRVSAPEARRIRQLERDLEEALRIGRWISDDERAERELERERDQRARLAQRQRRRKLLALLVVSLLIPPLWPLAIVLTLYILFPLTTVRVAVATGLSLLVLGGLVAVLITTLGVALLMALL